MQADGAICQQLYYRRRHHTANIHMFHHQGQTSAGNKATTAGSACFKDDGGAVSGTTSTREKLKHFKQIISQQIILMYATIP